MTPASAPGGAADPIRVVIVDDSAVVRQIVGTVIRDAPDFEVVGEAANGLEAMSLATSAKPDALILDLDMPIMDGAEAFSELRRSMANVHVVVFSNHLPARNSSLSRAIRSKEVSYIHKPQAVADIGDAMIQLRSTLLPELRERCRQRVDTTGTEGTGRLNPTTCHPLFAVVIGASTGGPQALEQVFRGIREPLPVPMFVVDHISAGFTAQLVASLDRSSVFPVVEAVDGTYPEAGRVYVAPGGHHLRLVRNQRRVVLTTDRGAPVHSCRPSVDVLFQSAARVYGANQLGVVLTGMGSDGVDGCRDLVARGAPVIVQDRPSSVVWGMPGEVAAAGLADEVVPIEEMAQRISQWVSSHRKRSSVP